ncbi:hypothetical protein Tco_1496660, partial [Tanacetum coccineum]
MPGYESDASEAASHSLEYAPPADDDMEPTEAHALPAPVLPAPLSHDYSADSEPIEDDPQEAGLEDDPEEGPSEEEEGELPAPTASIPAIAPFKEDESVRLQTPLPPSIFAYVEAWLAAPIPPSPLPSPLSPLSSPLPRIPSPPLPSLPTHGNSIPRLTYRVGIELDFPLHPLGLRLGRDPHLLLRDNLGLLWPKVLLTGW